MRRVSLPLVDAGVEVDLPQPGGRGSLVELLPAARRLAAAISEHAASVEATEGRAVRCKPRCASCCRHLVPISVVEARALADLVGRLPAPRRRSIRARFEAAERALAAAGLLAAGDAAQGALRGDGWEEASRRYFGLGLACPFLEAESCSIYADRPLVCRSYQVTSPPERCATLDGDAEAVPRPARVEEALAAAAEALDGEPDRLIPLVLALAWADAHPNALTADHDGRERLDALLDALAWE